MPPVSPQPERCCCFWTYHSPLHPLLGTPATSRIHQWHPQSSNQRLRLHPFLALPLPYGLSAQSRLPYHPPRLPRRRPILLLQQRTPLPHKFEDNLFRLHDTSQDDLILTQTMTAHPATPSHMSLASPLPQTLHPSAFSNRPTIMIKRMHAFVELFSSERAYASDLALIRKICIPLALGKSYLFHLLLIGVLCCPLGLPLPFSPNSLHNPPLFPTGTGSGSSS